MKKFIWILSLLLLTGCAPVESPIIDTPVKKFDINRDTTFKYELTTKNSAYLNNSGIKKLVSYASSGECFTYMVPRFHKYSQFPKDTNFKSDAYLKIESAKREEGIEPNVNNIIYTFRLIDKDTYNDFTGSMLVNELLAERPSISDYTGEKDYETFSKNFEEEILAKFPIQSHTVNDIHLYGEELEPFGTAYVTNFVYEDIRYTIPCSTYFFVLESGNYLCLHISVEGLDYPDLHNYTTFKSDISKDILKQLESYNANPVNFDELAMNIMNYVIVGDYSYAFETKEPETTIWERLDLDEPSSVSTFEEVEDFFTEQTSEEEIVVEEAYDYDIEVQDYFN